MSASYHCLKCGAPMIVTYRRAGFDGFWGNPVYVRVGRCPNLPGGFFGLFSGHSETQDRYPQRAEWFGFTDETIPLIAAEFARPSKSDA